MVLEFDTKDNEKQKLCAQKWIDNITEEISYGGAKGVPNLLPAFLLFSVML